MPRLMKTIISLGLLFCLGSLQAKEKPFTLPTYYYGIYDMALSLKAGSADRPLWDISSPEMRDKMFDRLETIGINMATYAYVYRVEGPLYPHKNPNLKPQVERWHGQTPVLNFLEDCQNHNMLGFLGIHVRPEEMQRDEYLQYLDNVTSDVVTRFKDHPAFNGFVPPVESYWQKITVPEYAHLAKLAKEIKPELLIMDFPSGHHVSGAVQCVQDHAALDEVDIENVQFFVGNSSVFSYYLSMYREMAGFRGLTCLLEGLCPNAKTMAHTHYMQGAGRANIPQEQKYRVSQNVLLTATRFGIHFFEYPHLFHGYDNRDKKNTLWRWIKWCEGVLSVQRYVPYYAESKPAADVITVLPRQVDLNGPDLVNIGWTPLASDHILSAFNTDLTNLDCPLAVLPSPFGLSGQQVSDLDRFVKRGGKLIVILDVERNLVPKPEMGYTANTARKTLEIGMAADQVHPQFFEMLNVSVSDFRSDELRLKREIDRCESGSTLSARGFSIETADNAEVIASWPDGSGAMISQDYGDGQIFIIPGSLAFLDEMLPALVRESVELSLDTRNIPESFILEKYTSEKPYRHEMLLLLNTEEDVVAEQATLILPDHDWKYYIYMDDERANLLTPEMNEGDVFLHLPRVTNYGFILMTNASFPLLFPKEKVRYTSVGSSEILKCDLLNITGKRLSGTLEIELPEGWELPEGLSIPYRLKAGERKTFSVDVKIPADAEYETYFIHFKTRGLEQRSMIIPVNGRERVIRAEQMAAEPLAPNEVIGAEWLTVSAGQEKEIYGRARLIDDNEYHNDPGVSFYFNAEWSLPMDWQGHQCRYSQRKQLSGAGNFWLNGAESDANYEVRLDYWTEYPVVLKVWDGAKFMRLTDLPSDDEWQTRSVILPADKVVDGGGTGNLNVLFELDTPEIYLENISVRKISVEQH